MPGPLTCPACSGERRTLAHLNRGGGTGTWEHIPCPTCGGAGTVSAAHALRIERGKAAREARQSRNLTIREEAARLGISPQALAAIENGRDARP